MAFLIERLRPAVAGQSAPGTDRRALPGVDLTSFGRGLLGGAAAAGLGLAGLALPMLLLWIVTPYAEDGPGGIIHLAACVWLLAHGAELLRPVLGTTVGAAAGQAPLGVPPLLVTVLVLVPLYRAGARLGRLHAGRPGGRRANAGEAAHDASHNASHDIAREAAQGGGAPVGGYAWSSLAGLAVGHLLVALAIVAAAASGPVAVGPTAAANPAEGSLTVLPLAAFGWTALAALPVAALGVRRGTGSWGVVSSLWFSGRWSAALRLGVSRSAVSSSDEYDFDAHSSDAYGSDAHSSDLDDPDYDYDPADPRRPERGRIPVLSAGWIGLRRAARRLRLRLEGRLPAWLDELISPADRARPAWLRSPGEWVAWLKDAWTRRPVRGRPQWLRMPFGGGSGSAESRVLVPDWLIAPGGAKVALRAALGGGAALLGSGALVLAVSLVVHLGAVDGIAARFAPDLAGRLALLLLCATLLPNAVVWSASYALGPGFALGGTLSPLGSAAILNLPAFPLVAALPGPGRPALGLVVQATSLVLGVVVARRVGRAARTARPDASGRVTGWSAFATAEVALGAAVLVGLLVGAGAAASGGSLGTGALAQVGPSPWQTGLAATAWAAVGVPGAVLVRWWPVADLRRRYAPATSAAQAAQFLRRCCRWPW